MFFRCVMFSIEGRRLNCKCLQILVIKSVYPDPFLELDPDPHWPKVLDSDPHWNQCGSTTLPYTVAPSLALRGFAVDGWVKAKRYNPKQKACMRQPLLGWLQGWHALQRCERKHPELTLLRVRNPYQSKRRLCMVAISVICCSWTVVRNE